MERKFGLNWLVGALLAFSSSAHAQGYFPFDEIPGLDSEPTVQIDLDPQLMNMFGAAAKGADQGAASALEGITNVRVRVYEGISIGGGEAELLKFVDDTSRTLEGDGWKSVVRVNEDGERVRIFVKPTAGGANAGSFAGLTLMVVDTGGGEAVFINLAGAIRPEQLGRIAAQMGMDGMFSMVPGVQSAPNKAPQPQE